MPATQTNAGKPPATLLAKLYRFYRRHQDVLVFGRIGLSFAFIVWALNHRQLPVAHWGLAFLVGAATLLFVAVVIFAFVTEWKESRHKRYHEHPQDRYGKPVGRAHFTSDDALIVVFAVGYLFWCGNWRHLQRVYPFLRGHSFLGVILGPLVVGVMIWDFASRRGA
jgi:hypothetical protein